MATGEPAQANRVSVSPTNRRSLSGTSITAAPYGLTHLKGLLSSELVRDVVTLGSMASPNPSGPGRPMPSPEPLAHQQPVDLAGRVKIENAEPANHRLTDTDRAAFRATTGYNLVTFADGSHTVVDDEGQPPKVSTRELDAMGTLAISLMGDRSSGRLQDEVSPEWFADFFGTYEGADMAPPDSWRVRVAEWFLERPDRGVALVSRP